MPFTLSPAQATDFVELMRVFWESFETPLQGFLRAVAPITNNDREGSLRSFAAAQIEEYKADSEIVWLKVVDSETGRIVGGGKWMFHETNPFVKAAEKPFEAAWYPEGSGREFVKQAVLGVLLPRFVRAQRAHACMFLFLFYDVDWAHWIVVLHIAFVLPEYRRRGVAKLVTEWGLRRADELGLESWVDSSAIARGLYEQYGFVFVSEQSVEPMQPEGLSGADKDEWEKTKELMLPIHTATLWRPVGGNYEDGVTVKPWEA